MLSQDLSDGAGGYCATTELNGKEFVLSQCFNEGTTGVGVAVRDMVNQIDTIPTIGYRYLVLQQGIKAEMRGMRLTAKAPPASVIIKREFGVRIGMSKAKTGEAFACLLQIAQMIIQERQQ